MHGDADDGLPRSESALLEPSLSGQGTSGALPCDAHALIPEFPALAAVSLAGMAADSLRELPAHIRGRVNRRIDAFVRECLDRVLLARCTTPFDVETAMAVAGKVLMAPPRVMRPLVLRALAGGALNGGAIVTAASHGDRFRTPAASAAAVTAAGTKRGRVMEDTTDVKADDTTLQSPSPSPSPSSSSTSNLLPVRSSPRLLLLPSPP